ncbi:MAG: hypothetical protein CVU90_04495 [Firmicutes bacterium HGW-Firmicutes-15]|nr:MAG: hypothetical protein CVU90_04495 [Firmicutes bacterium HGW-Firmicutes-15]
MCHHKKRLRGFVFAMTNTSETNEVIVFRRGKNGILTRLNAYDTGGSGTGTEIVDPLTSQGSLILSRDGRFLFAVNAGSNSISSFRVNKYGVLTLVDVEPSGGIKPNSLANFHNLLYVTNAGNATNASNVTGFNLNSDGSLTPIIGSTEPLSTANAQPACIVFSPRGHKLVVSELNNNVLSVFLVNGDGTLTGPIVNNSNGGGPFGSVFLSKGFLLVSEVGPNALSSYIANVYGTLNVISGSVLNGQSATCWVASSKNERFAYTSNAGNDTITIYRIKKYGRLAVVASVPSTPEGTAAPIDNGVSRDGRNLYVLNGNEGSISVFRIRKSGLFLKLIQVFEDTGLPEVGAQGLSVR